MTILSRQEIETLLKHEAKAGSPVLSVYLDVDQSRSANRKRGFEVALKQMLRSVEQRLDEGGQRQEHAADAERVLGFVSSHAPQGQSLVIFCDASEGLFWSRELRTRLRNDARWGDTPYLRPLLDALDEFERYGVILADRGRARLFTVFMGELEEHREAFAPLEVSHRKTTGMDHILSLENFRRSSETHVRSHLKQVAEMMDHLSGLHAFDRLVLAGSTETTSELCRLLPKRLRARVVASISLPVEAGEQQILDTTLEVAESVERSHERALVDDLLTAAAKQTGAVAGLGSTLTLLQEGRVRGLVYADGWSAPGWRCANCSMLFAETPAGGQRSCMYCGGALQAVDDLVEPMAERVLDAGGKVEQVRGAAAVRLMSAGGVGAHLRY